MRLGSNFSRQCARCGRCCHGQAIQLNPYEILCLSTHLGQGTSDFIARHTHNQGLFLRFGPDGACGFLGPQGCAVHPQRPLACRLYPLSREIDGQGGQRFGLCPPHPLCQALDEGTGSVADYLAGQGAQRFLRAADLYRGLVDQVLAFLDTRPGLRLEALSGLTPGRQGQGDPWLDVDLVLGQEGLASLSADPWQRMLSHQAALRARLAKIAGPA